MSTSNARERIIDAAADLFTTKGYHQTAIDEVAVAAQVAKGSIYYHFRGKEDLLVAVIESGVSAIRQQVENRVAHEADALDRLRALIETAYAMMTEYRGLVFFALTGDCAGVPRETRERVREIRRRFHRYIAQLIADGVSTGSLREVSPEAAAHILLGAIEGAVRADADLSGVLADLILQGLRRDG